MKESFDLRVPEEYAQQELPSAAGTTLPGGMVRRVNVDSADSLFLKIREVHRSYADGKRNRYFVHGWSITRTYTRKELESAELFYVQPRGAFQPAGEECGTVYDDTVACPECGNGAKQTSELRLDLRRLPRTRDLAQSIAGELVVSQRFAECVADAGLTGALLTPVRHKAKYEEGPVDLRRYPTGRDLVARAAASGIEYGLTDFSIWLNRAENKAAWEQVKREFGAEQQRRDERRKKPLPVWYQLSSSSPPVEIDVATTRAGEDPFDEKSYGRCSRGDNIGLNLLSEVHVKRDSMHEADIMMTRQAVGHRMGLLRPQPLLLLSPKAWRAAVQAKLKGLVIEVARLV